MKIVRAKFRDFLAHPFTHAARPYVGATGRWAWYLAVTLLVLLTVAVIILRFYFPTLGERKSDIEAFLSDRAGRTVHIAQLDTSWEGLYPTLRVQGVSMQAEDGVKIPIEFRELRARIGLASLARGQLVLRELTVVNPVLRVTRLADGKFKIVGPAPVGSAEGNGGALFVQWLLRQQEIRVDGGMLHWTDRMLDEPTLKVSGIHLNLVNARGHHRFSGTATLPERMVKNVSVAAEFEDERLADEEWRGSVYLNLVDLDVGELPGVLRAHMPENISARLDTQIWTEWDGTHLVNAEGFVGATGVKVPLPGLEVPLEVESLKGDVDWKWDQSGWRIQVDNLSTWWQGEPWRVGHFHLDVEDAGQDMRLSVGRIHLGQVSRLLASLEHENKSLTVLRTLNPTGEVRDLMVSLHGEPRRPGQLKVKAELADITVAPYRKFPGVSGFSGTISATEKSGTLDVATRNATVEFPRLFDAPLPVSQATGRIAWGRDGDRWIFSGRGLRLGNEDAHGFGDVDVEVPVDRSLSPFLQLRVDFRDGNGRQMGRYLPVKRMPEKTVAWLRRAILDGRITGGFIFYEGKVREFPFDEQPGRFEVVAHVTDAVVDYAPKWPRIEHAEGDLLFDKTEMLITVQRGRMHGLDIDSATVQIENLRDPAKVLNVQGKLTGPFDEAVHFLQEGPLFGAKKFSTLDFSGRGQGLLELIIDLPLRDPKAVQVSGHYDFADSTLVLSNGVTVSDLRGTLEFTESSVSGAPISARLLGGDTELVVSTPVPGRSPEILIQGQGRAQAKALDQLLDKGIVASLSGSTPWQAALKLRKGSAHLHVDSKLVGMASQLPAPLDKPADIPMALSVDSTYRGADNQLLEFRIGKRMNAKMRLRKAGAGRVVDRGELVIGTGAAELPESPGLGLTVRVPRLDLDAWLEHWQSRDDAGGGVREDLLRVRGNVGTVEFLDREFAQVQLRAERAPATRWQGRILADRVAGQMNLFWDGGVKKVVLDLDHLHWKPLKETRGEPTQPAKIPALSIRAKAFRYDDIDLGRLELVTSPADDGMEVQRLRLIKPHMDLKAQGRWSEVNGKQQSRYALELESTDLGETFSGLGFPDQIEDGEGRLEARFSWAGGASDFSLAAVSAELGVHMKRGRFVSVDPGAGRFLGLVNIDALARRLTLDFTDIFSKGFAFDRIDGALKLSRGDLQSDGIQLHGPAANIFIQGRAGVVAQNYDLDLTVMPQVGGSLPVVGGLISSPAAGAAIFLVQKIFKKQLAGIVQYRYTVKGPWDQPDIERTGAPPTEEAATAATDE